MPPRGGRRGPPRRGGPRGKPHRPRPQQHRPPPRRGPPRPGPHRGPPHHRPHHRRHGHHVHHFNGGGGGEALCVCLADAMEPEPMPQQHQVNQHPAQGQPTNITINVAKPQQPILPPPNMMMSVPPPKREAMFNQQVGIGGAHMPQPNPMMQVQQQMILPQPQVQPQPVVQAGFHKREEEHCDDFQYKDGNDYYAYAGHGFAHSDNEEYWVREDIKNMFDRPAWFLKSVCWLDTQTIVNNVAPGFYCVYIHEGWSLRYMRWSQDYKVHITYTYKKEDGELETDSKVEWETNQPISAPFPMIIHQTKLVNITVCPDPAKVHVKTDVKLQTFTDQGNWKNGFYLAGMHMLKLD